MEVNDLKKQGTVISIDGEPYTVVESQHSQTGRGKSFVRTKLKNLITGSVLEKTFAGGDKVEAADLNRSKASFLYAEGDNYHFMNSESYEQFSFSKESLGKKIHFLKDGLEVDVLNYEGKPVNVDLPTKIEFEVTETVPGVKGDTAQGKVTKPAKIETGYELAVPLFVKQGDKIRINTESGEYLERV